MEKRLVDISVVQTNAQAEADAKSFEALSQFEGDTLIGRQLEVQLDDGKTEVVTLRKVGLKNQGRYAMVVGHNEAAEIVLYTGNTEEWADNLKPKSLEELLDLGRAMNLKHFVSFGRRASKLDTKLAAIDKDYAKKSADAKDQIMQSRSGAVSSS